jgi:hypothetical protein
MRTSLRIVSVSMLAGALGLAACSSSPPPSTTTQPATKPTALKPDVVIPATGDALARGIKTWAIFSKGMGGGLRTLGMDSRGQFLAGIRIERVGTMTTFTDLHGGGTTQIRDDGTVVQQAFTNPADAARTIGGIQTDIQAYQQAHPEVGLDCPNLSAAATSWCLLADFLCTQIELSLGAGIACATAQGKCVGAQEALDACEGSCDNVDCPAITNVPGSVCQGQTDGPGYSCVLNTACILFGTCGTDSCGKTFACPDPSTVCVPYQGGGECCTGCQPGQCGLQQDSCGGTIDCGECCVDICQPGQCGQQQDSCGNIIDCGACPVACQACYTDSSCDTGWVCDETGDCVLDGQACLTENNNAN